MNQSIAQQVIDTEIEGLRLLKSQINNGFDRAIEILSKTSHHVVISGMGKAGLVGQKISATFASTGTPSFFMHPAEAIHGDFGMLRPDDVVVLLSFGGETEEITRLLPMLKTMGNHIIAITKSRNSSLGRAADVVLELGDAKEACPIGMAPTTSTTLMLVLGDCLAVALMKLKNFDEKQFAFFHPGGSLGKKMLKVRDIMRQQDKCPVLSDQTSIKEVIFEITRAGAGAAILVNEQGVLSGIFTDGDFRRVLSKKQLDFDHKVITVMTQNPKSILSDQFALEAVGLLKKFMIGELPVVDSQNVPQGLVNLKDLINIGLMEFSEYK